MSSNIHKYILRQAVLNKINNSNSLLLISLESGVNFHTLKRQVSENHEYLTLLKVLKPISQLVNEPIEKLTKKVKA